MTHTQKITKWEAAFARYVAALAKMDETGAWDGHGNKRNGAKRSLRAARNHMRRVDAEVSA